MIGKTFSLYIHENNSTYICKYFVIFFYISHSYHILIGNILDIFIGVFFMKI